MTIFLEHYLLDDSGFWVDPSSSEVGKGKVFRVLGTVPKSNKDPKPKKKTKEVLLAVSNNLQQPKKRKGKNNSKEKSSGA